MTETQKAISAEQIKNDILERFKPYLKDGALDFTENLSAQMTIYARAEAVAFVTWMINNRYDYNRATGKCVAAWDGYKEFDFEELFYLFKESKTNIAGRSKSLEEKGKEIESYEEVLADHRRLVREIDVIINGEERAAKQASLCDLLGDITALRNENQRLNGLLNSPELDNFLEGVKLESGHQTERWGKEEEENKMPHHYILVANKLLGKLAIAIWDGNKDKFKHHLITMAASFFNCHRQIEKEGTKINQWFKPVTTSK